jgi:hypothetical protein
MPDSNANAHLQMEATRPQGHSGSVDGANSRQVGGNHYKTGGEEHWDRVNRLQLDYFQGQITKYVERWKKKNGVEDLKKARHFLDKYIEIAEANSSATLASRALQAGIDLSSGEANGRYVDQDRPN